MVCTLLKFHTFAFSAIGHVRRFCYLSFCFFKSGLFPSPLFLCFPPPRQRCYFPFLSLPFLFRSGEREKPLSRHSTEQKIPFLQSALSSRRKRPHRKSIANPTCRNSTTRKDKAKNSYTYIALPPASGPSPQAWPGSSCRA